MTLSTRTVLSVVESFELPPVLLLEAQLSPNRCVRHLQMRSHVLIETRHLPAFHFVCLDWDYRGLLSATSAFKQVDFFPLEFSCPFEWKLSAKENKSLAQFCVSGTAAKTNDIIIDIMTDSIKQKMFWRKMPSFIFLPGFDIFRPLWKLLRFLIS